jgi:cell pole-organizing protein PopZ
MAETKAQAEPSMEEILASIRRIIAEDGEGKSTPEAPAPATVEAEEEVLELTEVVDEPAAPEPAVEEPAPPPRLRPAAPPAPPPPAEGGDSRLVSAPTAAASVAALSQLAAISAKRDGLGLGNGQLTIEELVRDLLKPMLRDWLDANLPAMVERLVHEEIERMVREAQQ